MACRFSKLSSEETRSDLHLLRVEMAKLIDDKLDNSSFLMNMMDKYKFSLIRAKKKKYLKKTIALNKMNEVKILLLRII